MRRTTPRRGTCARACSSTSGARKTARPRPRRSRSTPGLPRSRSRCRTPSSTRSCAARCASCRNRYARSSTKPRCSCSRCPRAKCSPPRTRRSRPTCSGCSRAATSSPRPRPRCRARRARSASSAATCSARAPDKGKARARGAHHGAARGRALHGARRGRTGRLGTRLSPASRSGHENGAAPVKGPRRFSSLHASPASPSMRKRCTSACPLTRMRTKYPRENPRQSIARLPAPASARNAGTARTCRPATS